MFPTPGTRLGPYEILAPLGAGGMGEVWRARDSRLQRDVAIKFLPQALANDPERLARFEREARVLGSLNHPHIGGLLGLEDSSGIPALVLELIEGPTLAEHLARRGALPVGEVIEIASQIADAMEYAHERGIVHRDLKPANVKFTGDESVKLLDFGLAKALSGDESGGQDPRVSASPTVTRGTHAGVILGTAAYMAPEQARGKVVDRRADIWAFGVVVFEMLSGHSLFAGETVSDTIARILEREPDWSRLPARTPVRVRELLHRCLEKDPRRRLRDIGDARLELESAARDVASGVDADPLAARGGSRIARTALVAALVAAAFAAGWWWPHARIGGDAKVVRLSVVPPANLRVRNLWVSPDGRTLLARGETRQSEPGREPERKLYVRHIDRFQWEPLPGTDGVDSYSVSADGQWVYFVGPTAPGAAQSQLSRVRLDGTTPPALVAPWSARWTAWEALPRGGFAVLIGGDSIGVIDRGQRDPGTWHRLLWETPIQQCDVHESLPDGSGVLGTIGYYGAAGWTVAAVSIEPATGVVHLLERNAASPRLSREGRLLMTRGSTVLAAAFDAKRQRRVGDAVAVFDGVRLSGQWQNGAINFSRGGTLVYVPGESHAGGRWLAVLQPGADPVEWCASRGDFEDAPSVSPDGRRAAITTIPPGSATFEIHLLTRGQPGARKLVAIPGEDCNGPVFSPDGRSIAFFRQGVAATAGIYVMNVDPPSPPKLVLAAKNNTSAFDTPSAWTPDGRFLVIDTFENRLLRMRLLPLDGGSARELIAGSGESSGGQVSPDGRTLAFLQGEGGLRQVAVAELRSDGRLGPPVQVSREGASAVCWVPHGRVLTFSTAQRTLMQCRVAEDLSSTPPQLHARLDDHVNDPSDFTVTPDGSILVTHRADSEGDVTRFDLVLGFGREVERALQHGPGSP